MEIQADWLHWVLFAMLTFACFMWNRSMNHWKHWMDRCGRECRRAEANWQNAVRWQRIATSRANEVCRLKQLAVFSSIQDDKDPL
jgi:hypothetical protein